MLDRETDNEHPHFARLASVVEVVSVENPLTEERDTVGNILTAATLVESMKEEMVTIDENPHLTIDGEDEDVDIMTLRGGRPNWSIAENSEIVTKSAGQFNRPAPSSLAKPDSVNAFGKPSDSVEKEDELVEVPVQPCQSEKAQIAETRVPIEAGTALDDDQAEWESLISYSEAEDNPVDEAPDIYQGISSERVILPTEEIEEMKEQPVFPSPNDTVGLDEIGQFVKPQIYVFENPSDQQPSVQTRLSLNSSIIPFLPTEQLVITSPPKRQSSAPNQLDHVPHPSNCAN